MLTMILVSSLAVPLVILYSFFVPALFLRGHEAIDLGQPLLLPQHWRVMAWFAVIMWFVWVGVLFVAWGLRDLL